jgi:hypothetical protein
MADGGAGSLTERAGGEPARPRRVGCGRVELSPRLILHRIEEREKDVRAFACLAAEAAIAASKKADAAKASGLALGPLHGLPVAVKDIIDTADMPTEFGGRFSREGASARHDNRQPAAFGWRHRRRKGGDVAICALRAGPRP